MKWSFKLVAAEGEKKASESLNEAANMIAESPCAIQLRYLQTLNSIRFPLNIYSMYLFFRILKALDGICQIKKISEIISWTSIFMKTDSFN